MSRPTAHTKAPISEALLEKAANGRLTPDQAKHLTELMASNPFVAEVLESVDHTNWAAIKSISERSTSKVLSRSAKHGGRKRYGWLQWSAVAVLLGTGAFWWIISDHDSKEKGSAISPKQAIVMELEKEAELVKEV